MEKCYSCNEGEGRQEVKGKMLCQDCFDFYNTAYKEIIKQTSFAGLIRIIFKERKDKDELEGNKGISS